MNIAYFTNLNGEKQEISEVQYRISEQYGRLTCPYCGERVDWTDGRAIRLDGKTRNKYFKHHHGTKKMECENYCADISQNRTMLPYEKIGLPLYILKELNSFSLNIGLYAISEVALNEASQSNLLVNVMSNKNMISTKKIDDVNFSPDIMHFIGLNYCSETYRLEFTSNIIPQEIREKWYRDVNGIGENGAVFEYSHNGGKKIKSSDGLRTNIDYYLLSKFNINSNEYHSIIFERIGEIIFNSSSIFSYSSNPEVYKINIKEINSESINFCKKFGMTLSYSLPKLIPLWPPCKVNDHSIIFTSEENRFFILRSDDKEKQTVFSQNLNEKVVSQVVSKNKWILRSRDRSEDFLSIGNSLSPIICAVLSGYSNLNAVNIEFNSRRIGDSLFQISSSVKIKIIRWKGNFPSNVTIVKQKSIDIEKPKNNERIEILHGLDELLTIEIEKKSKDSKEEQIDKYLSEAINFENGNLISVPVSLKWIVLELMQYPKTYYKLKKILINGKISNKTLNILKNQCLKNRGI